MYTVSEPKSFRTLSGESHDIEGTNRVRFRLARVPPRSEITYRVTVWPRRDGEGNGHFRFEVDQGGVNGSFSVKCEYEEPTDPSIASSETEEDGQGT